MFLLICFLMEINKVFICKPCFLGMSLLFDFHPNWVILFFAFIGVWAVLMISRKRNGRKNNIKEQVYLAIAGMFLLVLMEMFATQSNLWHYIPGDWPVILWPTYVAAILFGYQLLRFIEERLVVKNIDIC